LSIKTRLSKLEQQHGIDANSPCYIFPANLFGIGSEEDQLAAWQQRNPGIEPTIFRIRFVEMKPDNLSRESTRCV
jgi:hypothetical protein